MHLCGRLRWFTRQVRPGVFFWLRCPVSKNAREKHGFPRIIHYQWRFWMGFPLFSRDFRNMKKKTRDFVHFVFSWISVNSRNGSEVEISLGRHGNLTDDGDLTIKHLGWTISSWGLARGWSNKIQYDSKTLPKEFTSVNRDIDQHRDYTHWYGSNQVLWVCPFGETSQKNIWKEFRCSLRMFNV